MCLKQSKPIPPLKTLILHYYLNILFEHDFASPPVVSVLVLVPFPLDEFVIVEVQPGPLSLPPDVSMVSILLCKLFAIKNRYINVFNRRLRNPSDVILVYTKAQSRFASVVLDGVHGPSVFFRRGVIDCRPPWQINDFSF